MSEKKEFREQEAERERAGNCAKPYSNWTLLDRFNDASPYILPQDRAGREGGEYKRGRGMGDSVLDSLLRFAQNANLNSFQLLLLLFHLHFGTNTRRLGRTQTHTQHTHIHTTLRGHNNTE